MQEEVENRTVSLVIRTTQLTARTLAAAFRAYGHTVRERRRQRKAAPPKGKQTVKELIGQGQGVSSLEIAKTGIRGFERIAGKYGIDYAVKKDRRTNPPRYLIFFRAKDADALQFAFEEYTAKVMRKEPVSVRSRLAEKAAELARKIPVQERGRERER